MIELNLLEKRQALKLPSVLGIELNNLNFRMIAIAIFIYYIPEIFIHNHFEDKIKDEQENLQHLMAENSKIISDIGKNANVKSQLEAYGQQVEKLKARSSQVDEILKIKTNPKKVLEKIARSLPENLWFDKISINYNKDLIIVGGAESSRAIGEFITVVNDSPFFGNSITPTKQENTKANLDGVLTNFESFELKGKIKNYDMRSR